MMCMKSHENEAEVRSLQCEIKIEASGDFIKFKMIAIVIIGFGHRKKL